MARVVTAENRSVEFLGDGWEAAEVAPGADAPASPEAAAARGLAYFPALVPGTVASALAALGRFELDTPKNFDASDWWYRLKFASTPAAADETLLLHFDGLATLVDVWLNGELVLQSDNMFRRHALDVTARLRTENELCLRFRSLDKALAERRPRPRFRTRLVANQQLRWFRTTLLGRIPGWTPPVAAVGPFRGVRLERWRGPCVAKAELRTALTGATGRVSLAIACRSRAELPKSATASVGPRRFTLERVDDPDGTCTLRGEATFESPELWWPHTHGAQARHPVGVELEGAGSLTLGTVAFRAVEARTDGGSFALRVNGTEVFCRGACWTTDDIVSLGGETAPRRTLELCRAAGLNMLRVGGTMLYENDAFYELCDELGILVWQDFMFANLDYPGQDANFAANVRAEVRDFLERTEQRACLAVYAGNSEIEQQVAMLGLARELWTQPLFSELLPELVRGARDDAVYVPSTPTGGALPFRVDVGLSHYYGVGAYQRPLEDARHAGVRFTSECLAFANVPEDASLERLLADGQAPFHHPRWKARVPRDTGPGWDFDDVRDHYTRLLFGVDPTALRYSDLERALLLARATSGEVMARTFTEWRRSASTCRGALIWFLKDLWLGAGWGIIDAAGRPKAAYYAVKRALQPLGVGVVDEGLNGLAFHLFNDTPAERSVDLSVRLLRDGNVVAAEAEKRGLTLPPHTAVELGSAELFDHFLDVTFAYRFGPPAHDVTCVALRDAASGELLGEAFHFPTGFSAPSRDDPALGVRALAEPDGGFVLELEAQRFAAFVHFDVGPFVPDDAYFHLVPGVVRRVRLAPVAGQTRLQGLVRSLGQRASVRIQAS
ncbi:MAG TPA: glycoside hydrolase family 2 protein [Polyangiaceae bacterium]|nr:glycoside hydrolase family 2 protein [Polyangiaceae bacterium]